MTLQRTVAVAEEEKVDGNAQALASQVIDITQFYE